MNQPTSTEVRAPTLESTSRTWPLVGRGAERAFVASSIRSGTSAGVVLAGDAGVGKTRLAREALREAKERGCATTWLVATQAGASIPFSPFAHLLPETPSLPASRLGLLRLIGDRLRASAQGRRLVVAVDNAHLLDDASAALVHQLCTTAGVFVLLTLRAGEEAPDPIVALWKDGLAERLEVRALSEDQVGELVPAVLGGHVDGPTIAKLWAATRGNVLFLRELVLAGVDSVALIEGGGVWSWRGPLTVSSRLREVVAARLGTLDPDQAALMEVLAHGEPVPASFLEALFSAAVLETAERNGMAAVETAGRRVLVSLAHPIYGEVVRAHCPVLGTRAVHRKLATALAATGARRREDPLRLVTSQLEAGEIGSAHLLLAAARQARALFDDPLAERVARAAIDAGAGIPAQRVLVDWLFRQGRFSEAETLLADLRAGPGNEAEWARGAAQEAFWLWMQAGRTAEAEALLLEAEQGTESLELQDGLKTLRGMILSFSGHPAKAIAAVSPVLERPAASETASARSAIAAVVAWGLSGRTGQALALADRRIDAANRLAHRSPYLPPLLLAAKGAALFGAGHFDEAEVLAAGEYRVASTRQAHDLTGMWASLLGRIALSRGRVETAARWLQEAATLFRAPIKANFLPACLVDLACARALGGALDAAEQALAEAEGLPTGGPSFLVQLGTARTWLAAAHGEIPRARATALDLADWAEERGQCAIAVVALHDVARLGNAGGVAARMASLAANVEGPLAAACAAHVEALAAGDGRRLDRAAQSFETIGANLLAAEAAAEAAGAHRTGGRKASMLASSARAGRLLGACEGARTPPLSALAMPLLTPREREVVALLGAGLTSAEIARRLVLSVRTAENHVHNIYGKLGVSSRSELRSVLLGPREAA